MRRYAWIWLAGCIAWTIDTVANAVLHHVQHAELALLLAIVFALAYGFYRNQPR